MRIPAVEQANLTDPRLHEILLDVTAVKVALLTRGRNAWHSTWVSHYQGDTAMYTNATSAKKDAETRRGPGNVFYVSEAPALFLTGRFAHVVVVDFHPMNPFGSFHGHQEHHDGQLALRPGTPLAKALQMFHHQSPHWSVSPHKASIRTGMTYGVDELPSLTHDRLAAWRSTSQGTRYRLGWQPDAPRFSIDGTRSIAHQWLDTAGNIHGYAERLSRLRSIQREPYPLDRKGQAARNQRYADALDALEALLPGSTD